MSWLTKGAPGARTMLVPDFTLADLRRAAPPGLPESTGHNHPLSNAGKAPKDTASVHR